MHTAEELDRSVYRVSPDYPLDECARKKVEHRALVYSFRPFVRGIGDNASVSDNVVKKAAGCQQLQSHGKKIKSPPPVGQLRWWNYRVVDACVARV